MDRKFAITRLSTCVIKPDEKIASGGGEKEKICRLNGWDLAMLSAHYIQKGLLFTKPNQNFQSILHHLKTSLSLVLQFFPSLSGRMVTQKLNTSPSSSISVYIDCNDEGVEFVHAISDISIADLLVSGDVPTIIKLFFMFPFAVNADGHTLPLLAIQITELVDGFFVGCTFNHVVGDGTAFWNFFNSWAELCRKRDEGKITLSRIPTTQRWFVDGNFNIFLPFVNLEDHIKRLESPMQLREKMLHFGPGKMRMLREKANAECGTDKISSFQALSAHMWRCITRSRHLDPLEKTSCFLAADNRFRLNPPLSSDYFGNCIQGLIASTTVGELMENGLGFASRLVHESVRSHNDTKIRSMVEKWLNHPFLYYSNDFDPNYVALGSSPRFNMYGVDFGWGKPLAVRSGVSNKFPGKISAYPDSNKRDGVYLELCLPPEHMEILESDPEFLSFLSD